MSEHGDGAVNPGQAIYDALSDEAKAAIHDLPDRLFRDEIGKTAAHLLAQEVQMLSMQDNSVWSIQCDGESDGQAFVVVNAGSINTCSRDRDSLSVVVQAEDVSELTQRLGRTIEQSDRTYKGRDLAVLRVRHQELTDGLPQLLEQAHRQAVECVLSEGWKINQRWKWHRDDWRVKLAMITGADLPAPAYVPEDRLGLPMAAATPASPDAGQAIYDALSDEAKAAVDALPDDLFAGEAGLAAAFRIAELIGFASEQGNWCITDVKSPRRRVLLRIGERAIEGWDRTFRHVGIDTQDTLNTAMGALISRFSNQHTYEGLGYDHLEIPHNETIDADLLEEIEQRKWVVARENAADTRVWMNSHVDSWRVKLGMIAGKNLPPPQYVPESRIGLRMVSNDPDSVHGTFGSELDLPIGIESVRLQFETAGLTYSETQIASFYTALQTKGFVILSGISGTGKSKMAQCFADLLPEFATRAAPAMVEFTRSLDPYMKKYNLFVIPKEFSTQYLPPEPGTSAPIKVEIDGISGEGRIENPKNSETGESWAVRIGWKGQIRHTFKALEEDTIRVRMMLRPGGTVERVEILPELDAPDLPNVVDLTETSPTNISNLLFLSVRPDWRDGKPLIGYHNPLSGDYVSTDLLDFVIAASNDFDAGNRNAFFVILDEMNLAHVEYYFADVLSVIESGRHESGSRVGWTKEGIRLGEKAKASGLPEIVPLPPNLYIVGTVNMDETTHPFSPKVLDRAFTIELTEVDFSDYPPDPPVNTEVSDTEKQGLLRAFTQDGRYPRIDKGDIRDVVDAHPQFRRDLERLNASLRRSRMHFGYRIFDEIMQFVANAKASRMFESVDDAFDHAVLMKVLPKFNGSRAKLENALFELLGWCRRNAVLKPEHRSALEAQLTTLVDQRRPFDAIVVTGAENQDDDWRYPATGRRAALMMQDLYTDGFASFG